VDQATGKKLRIIFMRGDGEPGFFPPVVKVLEREAELLVSIVAHCAEIPPLIEESGAPLPALAYLLLRDEKDLVGITGFMQRQSDALLQGRLRVCVLSRLIHPKIQSALQRFGVGDVFEHSIAAKAFLHKLTIAVKLAKKDFGIEDDDLFFVRSELALQQETLRRADSDGFGPQAFAIDASRLEMPEDTVFRARIARSRKGPRPFVHAVPDRWVAGVKVARVVEVSALWRGVTGELIAHDLSQGKLTLELPLDAKPTGAVASCKAGDKIEFSIVTKNLKSSSKDYTPTVTGTVLEQIRRRTGDLLTVRLDPDSVELSSRVQSLVEERQREINEFLKAVQG
jgi:hypothetical protein